MRKGLLRYLLFKIRILSGCTRQGPGKAPDAAGLPGGVSRFPLPKQAAPRSSSSRAGGGAAAAGTRGKGECGPAGVARSGTIRRASRRHSLGNRLPAVPRCRMIMAG
jgi:hypothetical protein